MVIGWYSPKARAWKGVRFIMIEKKARKRICQFCWYEKWAPDQYFPDDYGKGYEMSYSCDFCGDAGITTSIWIKPSEYNILNDLHEKEAIA
jgi:hypothetical protein